MHRFYSAGAVNSLNLIPSFCLSSLCEAHQETFKQLLQHLYRLLQCRYVQEHESDDIWKDLDKCIKLLHSISKLLKKRQSNRL